MAKEASSNDEKRAQATSGTKAIGRNVVMVPPPVPLPPEDEWKYDAPPLIYKSTPAPGSWPSVGPPQPKRLLYEPTENQWIVYSGQGSHLSSDGAILLAMIAAAKDAVNDDVRQQFARLEPARHIWFLYDGFDPRQLDGDAVRRLLPRLLRNKKSRDESSWVEDSYWRLGFDTLAPASPDSTSLGLEDAGRPLPLNRWIESWNYVVQLWGKVAQGQNPQIITSQLVSGLKGLSDQDLDQTLRQLFADEEIGAALSRLALEVFSLKEAVSPEVSATARPKPADNLNLQEAKSEYETKLHLAMKENVFGSAEPSLAGFRAYLKRLVKQTNTSYEEKKDICKTVNYWKERLAIDLLFDGRACTLAPKTAGSRLGGYKLRSADAQQDMLYARATFPRLTVRSTER